MQRKKADPTDIVLLVVILFFLAISLVVAIYTNTKIKDVIDTTALNESSAFSTISYQFNIINTLTVQRGFVIFFGILIIGILVSSFLIRVHPVFIFIYIITLSITIFVAVYLSNAYEVVVANAEFSAIASNYATITFVMQHAVKILLAVGALSMIIIFGKIISGGESPTDI